MKTSLMQILILLAGSIIVLTALLAFRSVKRKPTSLQPAKSIYEFTAKSIDGNEISFAQFKGKKMLIVNVASECGYTPQYKDLEALHQQYKDKLVVIGFPANNFGGQEPGSNEEISGFCKKNYGVSFLMMEKISVKGKDIHPLYKWLSSKEENGSCDEAPGWNFCKYLIDENGKILQFYKSGTKPLSEAITSKL